MLIYVHVYMRLHVFSFYSDLQISFWYYMNGVGIGKLTLGKVENGTKTVLWEKEGRQGPSWIEASVNLPRGSYVVISLFYILNFK